MRQENDNISIQEPPLQELKKNRSCLIRSCTTSCGCLTIGVVIFLLILRFTAPPRPKELKTLPENFPATVPIYDAENIERITFTSGQEKNRNLEWAAYAPKAILIPIYLATQDYLPEEFRTISTKDKTQGWWQNYKQLVQRPVTKQKDTYEIEWKNLPADPQFIEEYYETELKKNDFTVIITADNKTLRQLTFSHEGIAGVVFIQDANGGDGTDQTILTVTLPK